MSASEKNILNDDEAEAIQMLKGVTFPVASWDKRFARHLQECLLSRAIGVKAKPQLWRIFIKYRRQTGGPRKAELLKLAEGMAAPDFRKQQAALREQARIDEMKAKYQDAIAA